MLHVNLTLLDVMIATITERGVGFGEGHVMLMVAAKEMGIWGSVLGLEISKICAFPPSLPSISIILKDLLTTLDFGVNLLFHGYMSLILHSRHRYILK